MTKSLKLSLQEAYNLHKIEILKSLLKVHELDFAMPVLISDNM